MESLIIAKENVKMIAHRGLSGLEKENTIAAFIAAGNRSYYGTECDVRMTADGHYVIIHDDTTERVSPVNLSVEKATLAELKEISLYDIEMRLGRDYLKIPTLEEYIIVSKKYQKECIVELKQIFTERQIKGIISIIQKHKYLERTIFISFYKENLDMVRRINKQVRLQFLTSEYSKKIISYCRRIKADIDIHHSVLTKEIVEEIHQNNIKVNVWTIDNPIVALMLVTWKVDYITTNILE